MPRSSRGPHLPDGAEGGQGACDQVDRPVGRRRQSGAEPLPEGGELWRVKGDGVGRSRPLRAEERRPEVVEVAEDGRHVDRPDLDVFEACILEQPGERVGVADREPETFIEIVGVWVELCRSIPEATDELHLAGVVPDVDGDGATRPNDSDHIGQGALGTGDEVED